LIASLALLLATLGSAAEPQGHEPTHASQARSMPPVAGKGQRMQKRAEASTSPAAALLEYLGEFNDAADGLDAMGLVETDRDTPDAAAAPRKDRQ